MDRPRISVITPNYNQGAFLEKAISSVLDQNYPNLEYIIIDGGSTDNSVDIIKRYSKHIHFWSSEKDEGLYYALNKGFSRATGEILCWLNSDDMLWPGALETVANLFSKDKNLEWLQGLPTVIDEDDKVIYQRLPVFIKWFFLLKLYEESFIFVQQESTFWRRSLWERAGSGLNTNYKVAGDFDLWMRFFKFSKLQCTEARLGAFRKRKGQLSSNREQYLKEAARSVFEQRRELSMTEKLWLKMLLLVKANRKGKNWLTNLFYHQANPFAQRS